MKQLARLIRQHAREIDKEEKYGYEKKDRERHSQSFPIIRSLHVTLYLNPFNRYRIQLSRPQMERLALADMGGGR